MRLIPDKPLNFFFHSLYKKSPRVDILLSAITLVGLIAIGLIFFGSMYKTVKKQDREIVVSSKTPKTKIVSDTSQLFETAKLKSLPHSEMKFVKGAQMPPDALKINLIKKKHAEQLEKFEEWASMNQWKKIKQAHYDWWMFPVNRISSGHAATYKVNEHEIEVLKTDQDFINDYKRGVTLVVQAWGWDLEMEEPLQNPSKDQYWDGYGVRLAKMSDSLQLFGEIDMHKKLKKFFVDHCFPLRNKIKISDLPWLQKTFNLYTVKI